MASPSRSSRRMSQSPARMRSPRGHASSRAIDAAAPTATVAKNSAETSQASRGGAAAIAVAGKSLSPFDAAMWVCLISLLAVPVLFAVDAIMHRFPTGPALFALGVLICTAIFALSYYCMRMRLSAAAQSDPYIAFFSLFAFCCVIDLMLSLNIDGNMSNMQWYLKIGEPYLNSPYGSAINLWDGTGHYVLYLVMVYGLVATAEAPALWGRYRPACLFWTGSINYSLIVLLCGGASGSSSAGMHMSTLLNVPFVLVPVWFMVRCWNAPPAATTAADKTTTVTGGLVAKAAYLLYLMVAIAAVCVRFVTSQGSQSPAALWWREFDPILGDESNFFRIAACTDFFYMLPVCAAAAFALVAGGGGRHQGLRDAIVIYAGASAQNYFSMLRSATHADLPGPSRIPEDNVYWWLLTGSMLVVPQLLAYEYGVRRARF